MIGTHGGPGAQVATTYKTVADYASEPALYLRDRTDLGGRRLLVLLHGAGGSALDWIPAAGSAFFGGKDFLVTRPLVERATTGVAPEAGGQALWANDTCMAAIDTMVDWARGASGPAGAQKVVILGHSLGGANAVRYTALHQSKVAGLLLFAASVDFDAFYIDYPASHAVTMDAAWGGSYVTNCRNQNKRPFDYAPSITVPVRQIVSAGDAIELTAGTLTFEGLLGSADKSRQLVPSTGGGLNDHTETPFVYADPTALTEFVEGLPT